nr:uncharacterized protein LOC127310223 [Lolium perenne]
MPKPPPVVEVGSKPRDIFLIHDDDDDDRSGGHGHHLESRSVVGMGGRAGRRAAGDRFGGSARGREGSSAGGHAASRSPPPRRNSLASSSPAAARAGAGTREPEVIELDDDDDEGYEVPRERSERAAAHAGVKKEPLEYSGGDSDGPPATARGRKRAAASAPGGSRKAKKWPRRESPVRRSKPHRAGGRAERGSSLKQGNRKGQGAIGYKGGRSEWRGSAPERHVGALVSSRTRARNGGRGKGAPTAKYPAPLVSDHSGDGYEMEEVSLDDDSRRPRDKEEEDVVKGKNKKKVDDSGDNDEMEEVSSDDNMRPRDNEEEDVVKEKKKMDDNGDNDEMEEVSSDDSRRPRDNEEGEDVVKGKKKVDDKCDSDEMEEVGSDDSRRPRDNEEDEDVVKGKKKVDDDDDNDEMEEVSSDDNRRPRDNEEEDDVVKGKNQVDDNADSEEMYKSIEGEESGEAGNGIQDDSYAGDSDDTTEPEEEEEHLGEEEEEQEQEESNEAGEEVRGMPSSNANAGGSARPGGDGTPPVRKKNFEGLYLIEKADTSSTGEGMRKRTRSQRRCSDKKLLTRGTFSKPYCIDVSESEPEPEEEAPPPAQAQPSDWAFEDDDDDGAPAKKRRRRQQFFDSDGSGSEDSSDDSETDRAFARNARKGPSSSRPTNGGGGAPYRQQQTAKEGRKDYAGCSNPRRVKIYAANANAGNPGNPQQGDVSFKNSALLPQKGKREKKAYDDLFNSIFDEIEKHPNCSDPAQAHQGWDDRYPLVFSFEDEEKEVKEKSEHEMYMEDLWGELDFCLETIYAEKVPHSLLMVISF